MATEDDVGDVGDVGDGVGADVLMILRMMLAMG
jgi:hypothetical protein